ncbi:MAG: aspartate ammonia-lyase [Candidatus Marsarchaeota archaeon]|nr:aspartate ammonia-lyase [Candidatus Marsarchaeota archaeon]MCL5413185.1 aspartate ammonia-lyase [Candidatus Marsarchaeota archaeon]
MRYRIDSDVLGKVKVPHDAYYGSETQRSLNNFTASGIKVPMEIIYAYAALKKAAAIANRRDGKLDGRRSKAISRACDEILAHKLEDQFCLDIFQAGAGTCINMNVNEVIANRSIEILGGNKGDYRIVHPNDHVNMSQSTNDTMPSVVHIAVYLLIRNRLLPALAQLRKALDKKSMEFDGIVKVGRTHLQDAVPITLGREFSGYSWALKNATAMLSDANNRLLKIPIGGTAVGTEMNSDDRYAKFAVRELNGILKSSFKLAPNRFAVMQQRLEELSVADGLKEVATAINKIGNDLRLLTSGPRAGMGEITLPEILPGSSIMPGKINPSMVEMMNMVCMEVIGNCTTVTEAANGGQLEINVFTPIIVYNLIFSATIMSNASVLFAERCIKGIRVNKDNISRHIEMDTSLATALSPYVGYAKAAEIARIAYREGKSVKQVCVELNILDKKSLDRILDPASQAKKY